MSDPHAARLTEHALWRMRRRGVREEWVREILAASEDTRLVRPGRVVVQGLKTLATSQKPVLIRVFVDVDRQPPEVVTVYVSTKVAKYTRVP